MIFKQLLSRNHFGRLFLKRYILFLLGFVGISYLMYIFFVTNIENQRYYGSMINLVGKQRMFAQRVIYLAYNITHCEFRHNRHPFYEERLQEALYEFSALHQHIRDQVFSFDQTSSLYALYFGEANLGYKIEHFIDLGYEFLNLPLLEDRKEMLQRMWLTWGGDTSTIKEFGDEEHPYMLQTTMDDLFFEESLSELLELATFNMQLLGESHLNKIKESVLWVLLVMVILVSVNAYFVVVPLLFHVIKLSTKKD